MGSTVFPSHEPADHIRLTNNTGTALVQYEFTVIGGLPLIADEAIANGVEGSFHAAPLEMEVADLQTAEDTFGTLDAAVYWDPATKKFSDVEKSTYYKIGIVKAIKAGGVVKVLRYPTIGLRSVDGGLVQVSYNVVADASGGLSLPAAPCGYEILEVIVQCRVASGTGTLKLTTSAPADITDAMVCAVDKTIVRAGTIDDAQSSVAAGAILKVIAAHNTDRGLVTIIGRKV
jgi:hypothetical protein